jgi:hypothetical protein
MKAIVKKTITIVFEDNEVTDLIALLSSIDCTLAGSTQHQTIEDMLKALRQ